MRDWTLDAFCERLSAKTPTPGGGSVAALSGALAASLGAMVARFSKDDATAATWDAARNRFLDLIREDSAAYDQVSAVFKLPKDSPERPTRLQEALAIASRPPAEGLRAVASYAAQLAAFAPKAKGSVASDLSVSAYQAEAAARGFMMNVRANTSGYKDKDAAAQLDSEAAALLDKTVTACRAVREATGG